jgi:hypothetical protein
MSRLKQIEEKKMAPRLDPQVAKRFVRNAIWQPTPSDSGDKSVDDTSTNTTIDEPVTKKRKTK